MGGLGLGVVGVGSEAVDDVSPSAFLELKCA